MPPIVSVSVGGTRSCLTIAWKHNRMPLFCKMATRTFKISEANSAVPRPRKLFYDMPITLRCANIFTPEEQFAGCQINGVSDVRGFPHLEVRNTGRTLWCTKRTKRQRQHFRLASGAEIHFFTRNISQESSVILYD